MAYAGITKGHGFRLLVAIAAGAVVLAGVLVIAQRPGGPSPAAFSEGYVADFHSLTGPELSAMMVDIADSNPVLLRRLAEDPDMRQSQLDGVKKLLTLANEAVRTELSEQALVKAEVENIRVEVVAMQFEKLRAPEKAFGSTVTDAEVAEFKKDSGFNAALNTFLDAKVRLLKKNAPEIKDREITAEERRQSEDIFARTRILAQRAARDAASIDAQVALKIATQVKLQQAQFLSREYIDTALEKDDAPITPAEIRQFRKDNKLTTPATTDEEVRRAIREDRLNESWSELADDAGISVPEDFEVPAKVWANVNTNRSNTANLGAYNRGASNRPTANRPANRIH